MSGVKTFNLHDTCVIYHVTSEPDQSDQNDLKKNSNRRNRYVAAWWLSTTVSFTLRGCSSNWQWQFIGVWTAAHHRTCRTTASWSPLLTLGGICVPPTVNYLQYLVTGSTLTAVGPFQLPAPQSGTLSRTRPSVETVSGVCLKRICLLDTSTFSALEVLTITALYEFTYLLTYLLQYTALDVVIFPPSEILLLHHMVMWSRRISCLLQYTLSAR